MGSLLSFCVGPLCYTTPLDGNTTSPNVNGTTSNLLPDGTCQLSPFDAQFSPVLSTFISSIIAGVTDGHLSPSS